MKKTLFLLISFVELGSLSPFFNLAANDIQGSKVRHKKHIFDFFKINQHCAELS